MEKNQRWIQCKNSEGVLKNLEKGAFSGKPLLDWVQPHLPIICYPKNC